MDRKWSNLNLPGALHFVTGNFLDRPLKEAGASPLPDLEVSPLVWLFQRAFVTTPATATMSDTPASIF
jgi:hypothetical protein